MMTYSFSREIAVKEGLRESVDIDKGMLKRPFLTIKSKVDRFEKEQIDRRLEKVLASEPANIKEMKVLIRTENTDRKDQKQIDKWLKDKRLIKVRELGKIDSFKNRVLLVYVEEQYRSNYRLRDVTERKIDGIAEIELDGFHDIAGRMVYINLDKKNGRYKVNKIIYRK